jgi:hypothetical protein
MKEVMITPLDAPEQLRAAKIALSNGVILEFPAPQSQVEFIHKTWVEYNERFHSRYGDQTLTIHAIDGGIYGFKLSDISAVLNGIIPPPALVEDDAAVSES